MGDLLIGGAVGAVMGEVLKTAITIIKKGREFKPTLESNIEILNSLAPLVQEMKRYNQQLDRPREEIEKLEREIQAGEELAKKCSKLSRWKFLSFPYYQRKLKSSDEALKRGLSVENARNLMEVMVNVGKILEILNSNENFGQFHGDQIRGISGAPVEPQCMGMVEPLNKLKGELLKGGVSVIVLTGLAGSGKSTLAKKLCWVPQIKGKFRANIFFVTVSKTPNLKTIVQTLFEYCRCKVPEFQSDEDATNQLGMLFRYIGKNPILLVLDDVWPNSELLIEKFKFQMSDYKILVTSRVAFRRFGTPCQLEPLGLNDAVSLFRRFAQPDGSTSYIPDDRLVQEIVKGCKGSPLALEVIGGSLCKQQFEVWQNMKEQLQSQSILESSETELLYHLQQSLDILEDRFSINEKECFMDLGLFPEDQRIPVSALIDMWAELYNLDEDGMKAMTILLDLTTKNLINLIVTRKVGKDADIYYNNHFVLLHDLLRDLAIHQSNQEQFEERKRLIIDLNGDNRPAWWVGQNQQSIFGRVFSYLPGILAWCVGQNQQSIFGRVFSYLPGILPWWVGQNQQSIFGRVFSYLPGILTQQKQPSVAARILSISTDENFTSDWCDMQPNEAEVLVLNLSSSQYTLPEFIQKMSKLKSLILTNYGFHRSEITKFELLAALSNLKRIRLEKVSVPSLCILKNLRKLSLHMCTTSQAFESCSIQNIMPKLVELSIDYCNDLVKLPDGICITSLKKLSITNCHKLNALPETQEFAKLKNLEVLRLSSCSDLQEMPEYVGGLHSLRCLDISDCISLGKLPEDIGDLRNLEKLYLKGCSGLNGLPYSVMKFMHLKHELYVICDEERASLWEHFPTIPNVNIEMPKVDISLSWLHGVSS